MYLIKVKMVEMVHFVSTRLSFISVLDRKENVLMK